MIEPCRSFPSAQAASAAPKRPTEEIRRAPAVHGGEADFAESSRKPRHGSIRKRTFSAVAKILRYRRSYVGRLHADQRRLVRGCNDDHRALQSFLTEILLEKVRTLTPRSPISATTSHPLRISREHAEKT